MRVELTELQWLDTGEDLSLPALMQISGLRETEVHELVEYGVISPRNTQGKAWSFAADQVALLRTAGRLRDDFGLDAQGLVVALTLLERVRNLERRLQQLDAQLPRIAP